MTPWITIGLGAICWRLSSLLVREDGPFDILAKFRKLAGVYYDEFSRPQGKNVFAKMLTCVWCTSLWVGLGLAWASEYSVNVLSYVGVALILSFLTIVFDEYFIFPDGKAR